MLGIIAALGLAGVAAAAASVAFEGGPGTKAPPNRLHGARMFAFNRDHRHRGGKVTTVSGPTGQITFSHAVYHVVVKFQKNPKNRVGYWLRWSHGYHGDVYYVYPSTTITLPPGTQAFYFYAEPEDANSYSVTASTPGATSGPVKVNGMGGAKFFGFVAKGGAELSTVEVASNDQYTSKQHPGGFAIGEFAIH
jgi:hypothetical protein